MSSTEIVALTGLGTFGAEVDGLNYCGSCGANASYGSWVGHSCERAIALTPAL